MRFTFQFNPLLYRVCNQRTWERLEQMDGLEVAVTAPPQPWRVETRWGPSVVEFIEWYPDNRDQLVNSVRATFPDGHRMTLLVFNSELWPITDTAEPATDTSPEG